MQSEREVFDQAWEQLEKLGLKKPEIQPAEVDLFEMGRKEEALAAAKAAEEQDLGLDVDEVSE